MRRGTGLARVPLVCAAAVLLVAAAGGGSAFWLCIPLVLLLAAPARSWAEAAAGAAVVALSAALPSLLSPSFGPAEPPALVVAVVAGSVVVLGAVRGRLEREREAMRHWALTDSLTGAANRRGLAERIEYEVARHTRQSRKFAIVMIDLDGFKLVNDRFGHHAGDELLRDVAAALREAVRDQDTVARLGGDEFCVLAPETDRAGAAHLADRVRAAVRRVTTGLDTLSASVGAAVFPDDGKDPTTVFQAADDAQAAAKRRSRASGSRRPRRVA
jgi:diguanylate cyclase (GGDEF)-like protein